ncbi:MAG: HPF/RaiA family ribosome-associated protein, partial [Terracidiphilus sp.]
MQLALTARTGKISKTLRAQAEEGMERIGRILGRTARGSITFSTQRHLDIVELSIQSRSQKIAAKGKGNSPEAALREAIAHAENQAQRHRDRRIVSKRLPKEHNVLTAPPVARPKARVEPLED